MSMGSPLLVMWVVMLQSQAIRLAVSRAMAPAPWTVARLDGVSLSLASGAVADAIVPDAIFPDDAFPDEALPDTLSSEASTDTMT
jgi:hypothetical protein